MDSDYKKFSLESLKRWVINVLTCTEASPQEIYDIIEGVVKEEYYYFKCHTSRCYELLALLNSNNTLQEQVKLHGELWDKEDKKLICDKDDKSPECQKAWNDFWEENYYPEEYQQYTEEVKDDCMPPWGHSDMEYLIAEQKSKHSKWYTEEELNAMCDKAASEQDKVVKWQLPVEVDGISGEYYIQFPDDLMEAANIKEDDLVQWIDRGDGSFELRKVTKPIGMEEC